ncbi:hypothetical protein ACIBL8_48310 [Streptomyces sp. NPDC050523]
MRTNACPQQQADRHHQLRFDVAHRNFRGENLPQWQIDLTGGERI